MNERSGLQTMPVAMGCVKNSDYTTYWVCVSKMRKNVPARIQRITAYQKAKKRRILLKKLMDRLYAGVCLGSTVFMVITLLNMAGMLPF